MALTLRLRRLAEERPYLFVVGLFVAEAVVAVPFVAAVNLFGLALEPLRLLIPIAQSVFMLWLVWLLGWQARAGFTSGVRNVHLYWYPVLLAFVPALLYGTVEIPAGPLAFYAAAVLFTGVSEEILARGVMLPVLLPRGKWVAVLSAAGLFSAGHLSNLFFEDFGLLEMGEVLLATFGFAVLYGGMFIRTGSIWPLVVLHAIHDYVFVTSGTAGPFVREPLGLSLSAGLSTLSVMYGISILLASDRRPAVANSLSSR